MAPQPTRALLTHFDSLHMEHMGERAVIQGGKDAKLLASICASHGPERVKELMGLFFASDDEFIHSAGYTVGVFVSQCGKLIARQRAERPKAKFDWEAECQQLHGGRCGNPFFHNAKKTEKAS